MLARILYNWSVWTRILSQLVSCRVKLMSRTATSSDFNYYCYISVRIFIVVVILIYKLYNECHDRDNRYNDEFLL